MKILLILALLLVPTYAFASSEQQDRLVELRALEYLKKYEDANASILDAKMMIQSIKIEKLEIEIERLNQELAKIKSK